MESKKNEVHKLLKYGEGNSTSRKELERKCGISDRSVRQYISALRDDGIPICSYSNHAGYFIADTDKHIDHYLNENHKRAMVILKRNKKVQEGYGRRAYDYTLLDLMEET